MAFKSMGVPTWAARQDLRRKDGNLDFVAIPPKQGIFPIHKIEDSPHLSTHSGDEQRTSIARQVSVNSFIDGECESICLSTVYHR